MESSTDEARFNAAGKTSVAEAGSSVVQEAAGGSARGARAEDGRHVATPFRGTAAVMQSLEADLRQNVRGEVRFDHASKALYARFKSPLVAPNGLSRGLANSSTVYTTSIVRF